MKLLLNILNMVMICLLVGLGIRIFQKQMIQTVNPSLESIQSSMTSHGHKKASRDQPVKRLGYEVICKRNLFDVQIKNVPQKPRPAALPEKQLLTKKSTAGNRYALLGTVTGISDVYAVIEDKKSRKQMLIKQGQELGHYKIKNIFRKKIVLSENGYDQTLKMALTDRHNPFMPILAGNNPTIPPLNFSKTNPVNIILDRAQPDGSMYDVAAEKNRIKSRPHFTNGINDGVIIYQIRPDSIYKKVGFHNGDILKSINGAPITSIENTAAFIGQIFEADNVQIELLRQGKFLEINYAFAE